MVEVGRVGEVGGRGPGVRRAEWWSNKNVGVGACPNGGATKTTTSGGLKTVPRTNDPSGEDAVRALVLVLVEEAVADEVRGLPGAGGGGVEKKSIRGEIPSSC